MTTTVLCTMSDSTSRKSIEKGDDDIHVLDAQDQDAPIAKIEEVYNTEYLAAVEKTALDPRSARAFKVCSVQPMEGKRTLMTVK